MRATKLQIEEMTQKLQGLAACNAELQHHQRIIMAVVAAQEQHIGRMQHFQAGG